MRPSRQGADQDEHEDDNQDGPKIQKVTNVPRLKSCPWFALWREAA